MVSRRGNKYRWNPQKKVINTVSFQDERLSYKARGILAYLLSKSKNWKGQVFDICNNSEKDGRTAVKSAMRELEFWGYAKLKPYPRKDGRFQGWYYEFYDTPIESESEYPPVARMADKLEWTNEDYLTPWLDGVIIRK